GGRDGLYRRQRGEALYTAVVVRLTRRIHAEDVNAKAAEIALRNGISDVRAIPVGYAVKIPVEDLAPEFRPPDDPERIEEEKGRLEAEQFVNRVRAADLSGVTFVLDAGHGGRDIGASVNGVEEARYVYDLACRVEALLREHTKARVVATVQGKGTCRRHAADGAVYASRQEVREAPRVSFSRRERIKAEGVSRDLADNIVRAFRAASLPLHAFQPVRRNVIRGGREWVPAILRYNRIPARALVEVCNL